MGEMQSQREAVHRAQLVEIDTHLNESLFRQFSLFDSFALRGRWKRPTVFAAMMAAFAVVCFTQPNGTLLGCVLLGVGLGLPAVWVGVYLHSVNVEAKKHRLNGPARPVYTVQLSEAADGVRVRSGAAAQASYHWADCFGVWGRKGCTYLYIDKTHAFLLPDEDIRAADRAALWALLEKTMPAEKRHK